MKTAVRYRIGLVILLVLLLALAVFLVKKLFRPKPEEIDPHAGQVYIYDGFDWVWMTPIEGVEVNTLTAEDFSEIGGSLRYMGGAYTTLRGVDVSEHQYDIDWAQVAEAGVDFAFIRVGRRGYTEGGLFEDPYFKKNMSGARANDIPVGVYFFSQAVTVQEAIEEARFVLDHLQGYRVSFPVVFDWEKIPDTADARTNDLTMERRTDCALAFCETVRNAGYQPCIYFNRNLGYYGYDLGRLTDYLFWFALPEMGYPSFYYAVDIWQYSFTESIPGISGEADMNLMFFPVEPAETPETAAETEAPH